MMPPERDRLGAPQTTQETPPGPMPLDAPAYRWYHKLSAVLLVTFCLEIGLFLVIFPWTEYWDHNYFSRLIPRLHEFWMNGFFRGAVSGLGLLNLYVSLTELFRLRRFVKRRS